MKNIAGGVARCQNNANARQFSCLPGQLIDGDNASPKIISGLLAEIANYGTASVRRIYGDWTKPNLNGWKECLLEHSIQPVQQFAYTTGKNATDSALIIDAMDILHKEGVDGFCIVSSDSDFPICAPQTMTTRLWVPA